jgi:hypothetical protein
MMMASPLCILALATIADAGVLPAPAAERPLYYDRLITREDLAGRALRELELMRATVLYRLGRPVPIVKGWLHYYLPTYLPGGYRALWKNETGARVPLPVDRQNAAFLSAYENDLPAPELEGRLDAIVAKHRYAGPPRRDELGFRAFSTDGRSALLTDRSSAMLVEIATGRPIARWHSGKGTSDPGMPKVTFFDQSGSDPPSLFLERGEGAKVVAGLTKNGRWRRSLAVSSDGRRLLAGMATEDDPKTGEGVDVDLHIVVVDLRSGKTLLRLPTEGACYHFLPDSQHVIVGQSGVLTDWSLDSGKPVWKVPLPPGPDYVGAPECVSLEPAPDGKSVFLNSSVIDVDSGRTLQTLPLGFFPEAVTFSPDSGRIVVAGSVEGGTHSHETSPTIWDAKRGVKLHSLSITNADVAQFDGGLAWSPDGHRVLVGGVKGPLLFDAGSGEAIPAFAGHERWWDFDEEVEAWLLARRLGRQIPALRSVDFQVDF